MYGYNSRIIEDFIESAIDFLDCSVDDNACKCELIHNIYHFCNVRTISYSKLRIFDILEKCGYFYLFDVSNHPDYHDYKDYFHSISTKNFEYIYDDLKQGYIPGLKPACCWIGDVNLEDGISIKINKLCCEAGSSLWYHFNTNKQELPDMSYSRLMYELAALADKKHDYAFMAKIYINIPRMFFLEIHGDDSIYYPLIKEIIITDKIMKVLNDNFDLVKCGYEDYLPDIKFCNNPTELETWYSYFTKYQAKIDGHGDEYISEELTSGLFCVSGTYALNVSDAVLFENFSRAFLCGNLIKAFNLCNAIIKNGGNTSSIRELCTDQDLSYLFHIVYSSPYHQHILTESEYSFDEPFQQELFGNYKEWVNIDSVDSIIAKSGELLDRGRVELALAFIKKGLTLDADNIQLLLYNIRALISKGNLTASAVKTHLETIDNIIDKGIPTELEAFARAMKGVLFYHIEDVFEGRAELTKACELNPGYNSAYEEYF